MNPSTLALNLIKKFKKLSNTTSSMASHISVWHKDASCLAIDFLKTGHVIALPTDTVYGLACCATNSRAIEKLYCIKARDINKPLAICVGQVEQIENWAVTNHLPYNLLNSLLPGPVTLVLNCANSSLDDSLRLHGKVGVRIPDYKFIRDVANGLNCPVALTSANRSSEPSSIKVDEFKALWSDVKGVFDGGTLGIENSNRSASTVIDLATPGYFNILRTGIAEKETLNILHKFGLKKLSVYNNFVNSKYANCK